MTKRVSIKAFPFFGALEKSINVYIWCALGAFAGWLSTRMMDAPARSVQIENVLIGMFGAFMGGDFFAAQINGAAVAEKFHFSSLALAVVGAVVALLLLKLMRKLVGPMKTGRSKQKKRDY